MATAKKKTTSKSKAAPKKKSYADSIKDFIDIANSVAPPSEFGGDEPAVRTMTAGSRRWPRERVIRSGSLQIDLATGIGGLPRGRVIEIAGFESAGKTTLCLHSARNAQGSEIPVLYIDMEYALDPNYMATLGVDLDNLPIAQPPHLEACIDFIIAVLKSEAAQETGVLIVLDSVAATKSKIVRDSSAEEHLRRGAEAARWAERMPVISELVERTGSTFITINQLRESQDMFSKPQGPGGSALRFAYSMQIHLTKGKTKRRETGDRGVEYTTSNFTINKNKVGSPYKKGTFVLYENAGISPGRDIWDTLDLGFECDYVYRDFKFDPKKNDFVTGKNYLGVSLFDDEALDAVLADEPDFDVDSPSFSIFSEKKIVNWLDEHPTFAALCEENILTLALDPAPEEEEFEEPEDLGEAASGEFVDENSAVEGEGEGDDLAEEPAADEDESAEPEEADDEVEDEEDSTDEDADDDADEGDDE